MGNTPRTFQRACNHTIRCLRREIELLGLKNLDAYLHVERFFLLQAHPQMKVVGLLSGGKDSCYNLLHCVKQGHEIVALASLAPPSGKDELDSYMYQTVGHDAVEAIARAMELPLYRAEIRGKPNNVELVYGARDPTKPVTQEMMDDETEDMYHLLVRVKQAHPDIEGVSVGAILSNYQRDRVEHVVIRPELRLQVLAYLWGRDQTSLLREMIQMGLDIILVKVACMGLNEKFLGRSMRSVIDKIEDLHEKYDVHMCGEGGEYETLCLDSPLFKKAIKIEESQKVIDCDAKDAIVAHLRIIRTSFVDKPKELLRPNLDNMYVPPLMVEELQDKVSVARQLIKKADWVESTGSYAPWDPKMSVSQQGDWLIVADIAAEDTGTSFKEEVRNLFVRLHDTIWQHGYDRTHITHVNVYLSSQSHFHQLNEVYNEQFGASPPTRACVALPVGLSRVRVKFDVIACRPSDTQPRRSLTVYSRNYFFAPSLARYSQAVCERSCIFYSGQIGIVPSTLEVPSDVALQSVLSIQNCRRATEVHGQWSKHRITAGCLCWISAPQGVDMAESMDELVEKDTMPKVFVFLPPNSLPLGAVCEWQFVERIMEDELLPQVESAEFTIHDVQCYFCGCVSNQSGHSFGFAALSLADKSGTNSNEGAFMRFKEILSSAMYYRVVHNASVPAEASHNLLRKLTSSMDTKATSFIPCLRWRLLNKREMSNSHSLLLWQ